MRRKKKHVQPCIVFTLENIRIRFRISRSGTAIAEVYF